MLVAGYVDHQATARVGRKTVFLEHGAGQVYTGSVEVSTHAAYSGGIGHEDVALFLCPSEAVADRWRKRYPQTPAVAIGVPKLDGLHRNPRELEEPITVALSFHSDARLCPESNSAWFAFEPHLPAAVARLRAEGVEVLGHGHPRIFDRLRPRWEAMGAVAVAEAAEIFARAHLLAVDNSSIGPEHASLGRPICWLNAPHWRRNVHHGGRFWEWPQGQVQCDDPAELATAILAGLTDPLSVQEARQRMVASVYTACDGRAAERAVDAIRSIVSISTH